MTEKRILFACFIYYASLMSVQAQSQRLLLLEHFTQASCPPCATWNPIIEALLTAHPDKITAIKYHVSWPGYDPMYLHNTEDVNDRVSLYNVSSVPHSVLDGNFFSGHPQNWGINQVNARYAEPSPFELFLYQDITPAKDSVYVTMLIKASDGVSGTLVAFMAVIEEHIQFSSPTGSNGEKNFYKVMKKLLPKKSGAHLPTSFTPGDYVILQSAWQFANVYNVDEIATVGFVQNSGTKEIHQAVNGSETLFAAPYNHDAEILAILDVPEHNCSGMIRPAVTIRNNGSSVLTSLIIHYRVNGGELHDYSWTGNLAFLKSETVILDESPFSLLEEDVIQVFSDSPSAMADDYPKNDTLEYEFEMAPVAETNIKVIVITDNNPQETTWDISNSSGQVILSGGPYAEPGHIYQEIFDLPDPECYKFTIYDAGGNGLCCQNGQGAWGVYDNNIELAKGGIFTWRDSTYFKVGLYTGIGSELTAAPDILVAPNPADQTVTFTVDLSREGDISIRLVNSLGQEHLNLHEKAVPPGRLVRSVDLSELSGGIYYILLETPSGTVTRKLVIK
ncbi:MAG: T9SS type A sorting domain-containing protein [Bacteroidales bacterium]|nr:T9SS type A sorting domain-containing protein [Bacteroidales bacterium]